ncbi:MAG: AAA family ATPase, partial [Gammaproteobacteria bacterium]|nr:AAA family ATPase [Gammaproteobacteria bacterium]
KLGTGQDGLVVIDENLTVGNMGSYVYVEEQINEMPVEENMYAVNEHDEMLLSRQDLVNQTWRQYKLGDRSHDSLIRGPSDIKNADELAPDFSNLASFLMGMRDNHPDSYSFLLSFLKLDIANFEDFILEPKHNADGTTTMDLAWKHKEFEFPMQHYHFSDGTLRFIAMATCMLQAKPPSVIIINEPELGLHFDTIESFVGLVKNNMQKSQIVIATQSPILVDKLNPEDVITVNQGKEGSEFKRLEHKDLDVWLENNTLGQLWVRNVVAAST